jgi:hypothetical protein
MQMSEKHILHSTQPNAELRQSNGCRPTAIKQEPLITDLNQCARSKAVNSGRGVSGAKKRDREPLGVCQLLSFCP